MKPQLFYGLLFIFLTSFANAEKSASVVYNQQKWNVQVWGESPIFEKDYSSAKTIAVWQARQKMSTILDSIGDYHLQSEYWKGFGVYFPIFVHVDTINISVRYKNDKPYLLTGLEGELDLERMQQILSQWQEDTLIHHHFGIVRKENQVINRHYKEFIQSGQSSAKLANRIQAVNGFVHGILCEDLNQSLEYYNQSLERDTSIVALLFYRSSLYIQTEQYQKAQTDLERYLKLYPNDLAAQYNLGLTLYYQKKFPDAIEQFNKMLVFCNKHVNALMCRGLCYGEMEDDINARQDLENALELDPANAIVIYNLACLFARRGETQKAVICIEKAVQHGFDNFEWMKNDEDLEMLKNQGVLDQWINKN